MVLLQCESTCNAEVSLPLTGFRLARHKLATSQTLDPYFAFGTLPIGSIRHSIEEFFCGLISIRIHLFALNFILQEGEVFSTSLASVNVVLALWTVAVVAHCAGVVEEIDRSHHYVGTINTRARKQDFLRLRQIGFRSFEVEDFIAKK
jgi:hypothetical protein